LENPKKKKKGSSLFLFAYYFSITRVMRGFGVCEKNRKSKKKKNFGNCATCARALPWRAGRHARRRRLTTTNDDDDD